MRHIIINGENIINFEDIYYYGEKLNNYCGDKLIYCQTKVVYNACTNADKFVKVAATFDEKKLPPDQPGS